MSKIKKEQLEVVNSDNEIKELLKEICGVDLEQLSSRGKIGLYDVEKNHNRCWFKDLYEKNKNNLDNIALKYRGTKITYREMFDKALEYAAAFEKMGIKEGMNKEIPMCPSYCPEFVFSILALNLLKVRVNIFGEFNEDYLTEIINDCNNDFMICTDDKYLKIKKSLDNSNIKQIILFSLADSLKNGKDPYIELDKEFYDFENRVALYQQNDSRIIDKNHFLTLNDYPIKSIEDYTDGNLDDIFLVTYSSGSTNANRPKAMQHANRSLVTIGRFQDADLSDLPAMSDLTGVALIPPHSNTGLISSLSDVLYKGCTAALEPIYKKEFFLMSMAINQPNYVCAPRNMVVYGAKQIYSDLRFKYFKMPYMMMLTSVGEPTSMGEEKFINKMMRKAQCGVDKLPRPLSPVPVSIGGGDCERGGMYFTPYRKLQDMLPKYSLTNSKCGLTKYDMVDLAVLDENGNRLPNGSIGLLVANTPTVMKGYKNNEQAMDDFYIVDKLGKKWTDSKTYGRIEKYGTVEVFERIGKELVLDNGQKIPLFFVGKEVEKDTKHILSYEVVNIDNKLVVHIEFQPDSKINKEKVLMGVEKRIINSCGPEVAEKVVYRIRSFEEGFLGTSCEKRNYNALVEEGITDKCIKPVQLSKTDIGWITAKEYFSNDQVINKQKIYFKKEF